jgi:hypothetical protein
MGNRSDLTTATMGVASTGQVDLNYQSLQVWSERVFSPNLSAIAKSYGSLTPPSAIPLTGAANYVGTAHGFYIHATAGALRTEATMNANVNFSTRQVALSTNNTIIPTISALPDHNLNLAGTLSYDRGSNAFSGVFGTRVFTSHGLLTGTASGKFYGPSAQELGGVYSVTSLPDGPRMIGAFAGKR